MVPVPVEGGLLARLPDTFGYSEASELIGERQFRRLLAEGRVVVVSRGLYRKSEWLGDEDLVEIAARSPRATLCLRSALARHELIDDIPGEIDIAVPRGSWTPVMLAPVRWRHFDQATFEVGREVIEVGGGRSIGIFLPSAASSMPTGCVTLSALTWRSRHCGGG